MKRRFTRVSVTFKDDMTISILDNLTNEICTNPRPTTILNCRGIPLISHPSNIVLKEYERICAGMNEEYEAYVKELNSHIK